MDWSNRLILGDSLLVMNSLLTKEAMAGKVQMIYIDPPYGITYNSNFQPTLTKKDVKEGDDESLTREPEQIKVYRDTWKLGIHSYLNYLRDRLAFSRELLCDKGSIFVQISDRNLHLVKCVLDEIFGSHNFVRIISIQKRSPQPDKYLSGICDYLVWYAKNRETMKYRQLYTELEGPDEDFVTSDLTSSHFYQSPPFEFKGKSYTSGNRYWSTNIEGLKNLAKAGRLVVAGNTLRFKRLNSDWPYKVLGNIWTDVVFTSFGEDKLYVVQTSVKVLQRCVLMTTDPGDIVLDPTCGAGTTAYVAEQWGRRWVTCDTSRVATSIARQRLITSTFPYYQLAQPSEGVASGFAYEGLPHVTMKSIAHEEPPQIEILYDRPIVDKTAVRVSGPFTLEAIPSPSVEVVQDTGVPESQKDAEIYVSGLMQAIRKSGVIFPNGKVLKLEGIVPISSSGFLHGEGDTSDAERKHVAISFGPRFGPLGARQAEEAIRSATVGGYELLILAGFQIDPAAEAFVQRTAIKLDVQFAHINPDMEIHDLLKQTQGSQLFSVFGEPDIEVKKTKKEGMFEVKLLGVDVYNPITGGTEPTSGDSVPAWFLDEDYDGYSFNICQAFFPNGATGKNPWDKLENALHGIIDKEKIEQLKTNESLPFELGEHKTIALKVIDNRGNEVIKIRKLDGPQKV